MRTAAATVQESGLSPAPSSTYAAVYNVFNFQPPLIRRPTLRQFRAAAHQAWAEATVAA